MKISNLAQGIARMFGCAARFARRKRAGVAAAVLTGGLMFSGAANGANVVVDNGFENVGGGWTGYNTYAQSYSGINGPKLNEVGTLTDYGFYDNISDSSGALFAGVNSSVSQTVTLANGDLTGAQILAGEGRFAFSSWLAACCGDVPKITATFNDAGSTSITFNRGIATDMVTSADVLVNPAGPNNAQSLGVVDDVNRRYWALYESKGIIPTDATQVTIVLEDGRADAANAGSNTGGNGNDNYADMVIFDAVAFVAPSAAPEPSTVVLLGLGLTGLLASRRRRSRS